MMVLAEPVQITLQIVQVFDRLNFPYFVGGSLASSLHGVPRATQDVDIVTDIKIEHIPQFVKAFESEFYIDADMIRDAIQHRTSFNIIHLETMFKVDIFILKPDKALSDCPLFFFTCGVRTLWKSPCFFAYKMVH